MYYKMIYKSEIGNITLIASKNGLAYLFFDGQKYVEQLLTKEEIVEDEEFPILVKVKKWLDDYFNHLIPNSKDIPIELLGSQFQKEVWLILMQVPYGKTITYTDIAKAIAQKYGTQKMSAQAVGGAIAHNKIAILIPCHRVIGKNGSLTGYAGGLDKKLFLLHHEGINIKNNFLSKNK